MASNKKNRRKTRPAPPEGSEIKQTYEFKDSNNSKPWGKLKSLIPWGKLQSLIAVISFIFSTVSFYYSYQSNERVNYDSSPNFTIVQNLAAENPNFVLFNESTKKLESAPNVNYFLLIPTKIRYLDDGETYSTQQQMSTLTVFSSVPLSNAEYRERSGTTVSQIEKITLPKEFNGVTDLTSSILTENVTGLGTNNLAVESLQYLVIVAEINYKFIGEKRTNTEYIISTPLNKNNVSKEFVDDVKSYISDTNQFSSVNAVTGENIYKTANTSVVDAINKLGNKDEGLLYAKFFGGSENNGYNCSLLYLSGITSPKLALENNVEDSYVIPSNYKAQCKEKIEKLLDQFSTS